MRKVKYLILLAFLVAAGYYGHQFYTKYVIQNEVLKKIITRLEADSRVGEVLVTDVHTDEHGNRWTTIKFLEYDTSGQPLEPKYFRFLGNIIQFQSLVVRFDDVYIRGGDPLRGKSAYLFWKAFILEGPKTQEFEITKMSGIPAGYKLEGETTHYEKEFWKEFWQYALDPNIAQKKGIKNAQLEAPGTKFIPGLLYTLKIEHDGGIRIDVSPIPQILKGEKIIE
jgi:hypothetical protein